MEENRHNCSLKNFSWGEAGPAIVSCKEDESGELWVSNGEYATQVDFCPGCGFKAKTPNGSVAEDKGCRVGEDLKEPTPEMLRMVFGKDAT